MLPESTFPVTGGIMQTEEVGICSKSAGLDCPRTQDPIFNHPAHIKQNSQCSVPSLLYMTIKQEPQEVDSNTNNVQDDVDSIPSTSDDEQINEKHQNTCDTNGKMLDKSISDINKARPSRGRRKARWKLKFHHQALPPEYLDHYEAALAQEALNTTPVSAPEPPTTISPATTPASPTVVNPIVDVQRWLQRIAIMQKKQSPTTTQPDTTPLTPDFRKSIIATPTIQPNSCSVTSSQKYQAQPLSRPPMKYSDLPYMGEITLDNSKPRRGRKPKKADICHLIYKNYGTILPGTPGHEDKCPIDTRDKAPQVAFQRSDIQNRISSLLEKRLTQESRKGFIPPNLKEQDEPLNLCVRDEHFEKPKLLCDNDSHLSRTDSTLEQEDVDILGTPCSSDLDSLSQMDSVIKKDETNDNDSISNPGFVYWPNAGVFIHPMTLQSQFLYYQKMDQERKNLLANDLSSPEAPRIAPKSQNIGSDTKCVSVNVPRISNLISPAGKRSANQTQPIKRKRSAIFIPPMPTENNNNPATEVSICKFKFTGGAKPSLQEKKSLSVDSGGNFRYYSGTGDKNMRGYEFFPRESLQQPSGQNISSSGTFLNAAEKIAQPIPHVEKSIVKVNQDDGRRKRKTRKSLQREKLEQTFKEKGFLIQTQQLESAEGATYCKFRQLRKFTRYLFRSWKDYLPGNVRELTDNMESENPEAPGENETVEVPVSLMEDPQMLPLN